MLELARAVPSVVLLALLAGGAQASSGAPACLSAVPAEIRERFADGCRFSAVVQNGCGHEARFAVVRALPHPQRGPVPTTTGVIGRFQSMAVTFEREICEQRLALFEIRPDASLVDLAGRTLAGEPSARAVEARLSAMNACVARCPAPVLDDAAIRDELRERYRHAVDDDEARANVMRMVGGVRAERERRDAICAARCQGRLDARGAEEAEAASRAATLAATTAAAAALAAIAARPPRHPSSPAAAVDPAPPGVDAAPRRARGRPTGNRNVRVRECRSGPNGQRCSFVLTPGASGRGG